MALTDTLTDIGDAIRTKDGSAGLIPLLDMPDRILAIPSGSVTPDVGFMPTEWDSSGRITKGRWYGATIPSGAFAGYNASYGAFYYLTELEADEATYIVSYVFTYSGLVVADFPAVTTTSTYSFRYATKLTSAYFPSVYTFSNYSFANCTNLAFVDCTASQISDNAFNAASALTTLILRREQICTLGNTNVFTGTPIASGTGYVYVPASLVDGYKSATNWVTFANQIRAIEDYPEITGGAA